jgi:glucokinase
MHPGLPPGYPRLVGDIGGTNARFALVEAADRPPSRIEVLPCAAYPALADAINGYLSTHNARPHSASLGMANPLQGDWVQMTNHHWSFSAERLCRDLALERLVLLNDFTALALGVPSLEDKDLRQVGAGTRRDGPMAILGPGTGLGVSGLMPVGQGHVPLAGEGGHVTLPASNAEEAAVTAWMRQRLPHVSAERALSGPGLVLLHQALAAVRGQTAEPCTAASITQQARLKDDALCSDTVAMFCALLGTVASDLALTLGAVGGVYLGGGIVPAMGELFHASPFRQRFEDKGRFSDYLARIPTFVIHAPYCAIDGAAHALDLAALPAGCVDVKL